MSLREILAALPATALLPVGWVIEQLADAAPSPAQPANDLSASQFAQLVGRSSDTVRAWCLGGHVPGAYKLPSVSGRAAWRIPAASVELFRQQQKPRTSLQLTAAAEPAPTIGDWRRVRRRGKR